MDSINWDKWQEEVDGHNPNCPWIDDEDEMTEQEKNDWKADEEED